jgi:hypothetical protein
VASSATHWFDLTFGWQNFNEPEVLGCTSMVVYGLNHQVHYCSCLSLITGACKSAREFGIQRQFSFVSDKSQVAFSIFSDGDVNSFAQWLPSLFQLNYHDQVSDFESLCKLSVQIFSGPFSVIYRLICVSASVFKLWHIHGLSFLFTARTSEERYGFALLQWEIAWQLVREYFDVSIAVQLSVVDDQYLLTGTAGLFLLTKLWVIGFISQYFQGHTAWALLIFVTLKVSQYVLARVSSQEYYLGAHYCHGNIFERCPLTCYVMVLLLYWNHDHRNLCVWYPALHCTATLLMQICMTMYGNQWIRYGASLKCNHYRCYPGGCTLAVCSFEKRGTIALHCYEQFQWSSLQLACAFRIWLVAWLLDGLEFSTCRSRRQAPFQGGRDVLGADFSDEVQVSHNYCLASVNQIPVSYDYIDQTYYFATVCSDINSYHAVYHGDLSKTKEVHLPWDPGGLSVVSAWGQAEFQ